MEKIELLVILDNPYQMSAVLVFSRYLNFFIKQNRVFYTIELINLVKWLFE